MKPSQIALIVISAASIIFLSLAGCPRYNVWRKEQRGKAQLREAQYNRQIIIEEAAANLEAEKLNAQAEVERAKGVAEANRIIGEGLKGNSEYILYLWVKALADSSNSIIYVPTEANIPIMEATRLY